MEIALSGEVEPPAITVEDGLMLPEIYRDALLRNITPVCPVRDRLGVGFSLADGTVVRLALEHQECAHLAEMLVSYMKSRGAARLAQEQGGVNV